MEQAQFEVLMSIVQSVGMWAVFAWLYITERKAHDDTRQRWLDDLRDIAGLKASLKRAEGLNGDRPSTEPRKPVYPLET